MLKAKLAKLKSEILAPSKSGGSNEGNGFDVSKTGDARVGLIGFPSVGKSTLLSELTDTVSEVASYEFTTLTCIPGIFTYKGCRIQLLDLPGIIEGAKDGKGRGKQVIGVARTCNLILIVLDATKNIHIHKSIIVNELEGFGIRLNQSPPDITIKRKDKGGINCIKLNCTLPELSENEIIEICKEYKISSAEIIFRENVTADQLIDVLENNRIYVSCIFVYNKIDLITIEELHILSRLSPNSVFISAHKQWNFNDLYDEIWNKLNMKRVYTKPKGQIPDYSTPVILPHNKTTVADFCKRIHKNLLDNFKIALVWGSSVKHNPQKCGKEHQLHDEDVIQIIKKV